MPESPQNPSEEERRRPSIFSILLFFVVIGAIAFSSVQLVKLAPSGFTSLASLVESVNPNQANSEKNENTTAAALAPIVISANTSLVTPDDEIELSWDNAKVPGSYTFSYECSDGVAINLIDEEGERTVECDTVYNLGSTDSLKLAVESEKKRYTDIKYTIAFLGTNDTEARATGTDSFTVMNPSVQNTLLATNTSAENDEDVETSNVIKVFQDTSAENPQDESEVIIEEPVTEEQEDLMNDSENGETDFIVNKNTEEAQKTASTETEWVAEYSYEIPVSNPNGRTDLATRYVDTGSIIGNVFFPENLIKNEDAAMQFVVQNFGTKTSDRWTFRVTLPSGDVYESPQQAALKPNEKSTLTIGFRTFDQSNYTFTVQVEESSDENMMNDSFAKTVQII